MRNFHNVIPFPMFMVARAAEDAAFEALDSFRQARIELALPIRTRPVTVIHADVIRAHRLAESLNQAATRRTS